jgi:hypothetical protein
MQVLQACYFLDRVATLQKQEASRDAAIPTTSM